MRCMKKTKQIIKNMRKLILFTICLISIHTLNAQTFEESLHVIFLKKNITLHFRSPENINNVDISSHKIVGDIPVDNIAKIKLYNDSIYYEGEDLGIITVIGDSYLAQYKLIYSDVNSSITDVAIEQEDMKPTQFPNVSLTTYELRDIALKIQQRDRRFKRVRSKGLGMKGYMNNIYAFGDFIFLDLTFENTTQIKYNIDLVRFLIEDKKIYKATTTQSIEIKPVFVLYDNPWFHKTYRNVYVFKKFTYPNDKVLKCRIMEEQISGRMLELSVDYKELLNADTF